MTPRHSVASALPVAPRAPHRRPLLLTLLLATAAALAVAAAAPPAAAAVLRRRPGAAAGAADAAAAPSSSGHPRGVAAIPSTTGGWTAPYGVPSSAAALILAGADAFPAAAAAVQSASMRVAPRRTVAAAAAGAAVPATAAATGWAPAVVHVETADTCPCVALPAGGMCISEEGRGICTMRKCEPKWVCVPGGAAMCRKRPARTALTCTVAFGGWGPNVVVCPCEHLPTDGVIAEPMDLDRV